jgi:hypothetical protein
MAVIRKPKSVDEFITAGSAVENSGVTVKPVQLRLSIDLLEQIDNEVSQRRPVPSRHQWILEAIYEKLQRTNNTDGAGK